MWKNLRKIITPIINCQENLLTPESLLHQQLRTTFILKRRTPPLLHKKGSHPKRLKNKHYVYDLVQDTLMVKQPNIEVILTSYVASLGNVGDKVSVRPNYAYNNLLLPGLAVYATPENVEKYKDVEKFHVGHRYSSPTAEQTLRMLAKMTLSVIMSRDVPWSLQPWHIKTSFRKCGYNVPEHAITLPPKPITGPNMDIQNKEFYITVTINNKDKVNIRCRIHHWSTAITERIPYDFEFWKRPSEPIFPEDAPILASLPIGSEDNKNTKLK